MAGIHRRRIGSRDVGSMVVAHLVLEADDRIRTQRAEDALASMPADIRTWALQTLGKSEEEVCTCSIHCQRQSPSES